MTDRFAEDPLREGPSDLHKSWSEEQAKRIEAQKVGKPVVRTNHLTAKVETSTDPIHVVHPEYWVGLPEDQKRTNSEGIARIRAMMEKTYKRSRR